MLKSRFRKVFFHSGFICTVLMSAAMIVVVVVSVLEGYKLCRMSLQTSPLIYAPAAPTVHSNLLIKVKVNVQSESYK